MDRQLLAIFFGGSLLLANYCQVYAQDFDAQQRALKEIRETAADICYTVSDVSTQRDISGNINAKLNGIISRLVDVGIAGQIRDERDKEVVREQLASAIAHSADCRRDVLNILVDRLLPKDHDSSSSGGTTPGNVHQQTKGNCSPAVVGARDVNVDCR